MSDRGTGRNERAWWARIALPAAGFTVFGLVVLVGWLLVRPEEDRLEPIRTVNQAGDTLVYSGRVRDAIARARIVEALNSTAARAQDAAGAESAGDSARLGAVARDARQAAVDALARLYADSADPEAVAAAMNLAIIDFAAGTADLPPDAAGFIQGAAEVIQRVPDGTIIVVAGYVDDAEGSEPGAEEPAPGAPEGGLAGRRARAVVDALVDAGADPGRLRAEAREGERPETSEEAAGRRSGQILFELSEPAVAPGGTIEPENRQSDTLPGAATDSSLEDSALEWPESSD